MQRTLTKLGLYKDKIDGKAGMLTRAALGAYQKANRLKVDCWPTAAVLEDMQSRGHGTAHGQSRAKIDMSRLGVARAGLSAFADRSRCVCAPLSRLRASAAPPHGLDSRDGTRPAGRRRSNAGPRRPAPSLDHIGRAANCAMRAGDERRRRRRRQCRPPDRRGRAAGGRVGGGSGERDRDGRSRKYRSESLLHVQISLQASAGAERGRSCDVQIAPMSHGPRMSRLR